MEVANGRLLVPGTGFEPAKHYAEELESTPFDHSGTPALCVSGLGVYFCIFPSFFLGAIFKPSVIKLFSIEMIDEIVFSLNPNNHHDHQPQNNC